MSSYLGSCSCGCGGTPEPCQSFTPNKIISAYHRRNGFTLWTDAVISGFNSQPICEAPSSDYGEDGRVWLKYEWKMEITSDTYSGEPYQPGWVKHVYTCSKWDPDSVADPDIVETYSLPEGYTPSNWYWAQWGLTYSAAGYWLVQNIVGADQGSCTVVANDDNSIELLYEWTGTGEMTTSGYVWQKWSLPYTWTQFLADTRALLADLTFDEIDDDYYYHITYNTDGTINQAGYTPLPDAGTVPRRADFRAVFDYFGGELITPDGLLYCQKIQYTISPMSCVACIDVGSAGSPCDTVTTVCTEVSASGGLLDIYPDASHYSLKELADDCPCPIDLTLGPWHTGVYAGDTSRYADQES